MRTIGLVSLLAMSASIGVHAHELGSSAKNTIIDKKEASNYTASNDREVYLQVATFKQANNAVKYKRHVSTLTKYPVSIKVRGHFHVVLVGPINDTADLRALTKTLLNKSSLVVKHNNTMATESVERIITGHRLKQNGFCSCAIRVYPVYLRGRSVCMAYSERVYHYYPSSRAQCRDIKD